MILVFFELLLKNRLKVCFFPMQTDESWGDKKRQLESSSDDLKLEKYLRHRLRTGRMQGLRLISPPMVGDHSVVYASQEGLRQPLTKPPIRGSLEGLNQEIERIVLKDFDDKVNSFIHKFRHYIFLINFS